MKQYERNVTSQFGEDGVIEEVFSRIVAKNMIAVDIGAWDGKYLSNTWSLSQNGWQRILSESDRGKTGNELLELAFKEKNLQVCAGCYDIDAMLDSCYYCVTGFDFLNIDIDGDDFYLWQGMVKYKPRVICIEYNQTVPPHISIIQERGGNFGASFKALYDLGMQKGYTLVHATVTNLIFVLQEYRAFFPDFVSFPDEWICYCVIGYNGKKYMIGHVAHNDNQGGKHEKLITDATVINI